MARGPAAGTNRGGVRSMDTVREQWEGEAPDWVLDLAAACDASSQNAVAKRIGYSAAAVSNVLRNRYCADTHGIEQAVRVLLGEGPVECPAIGRITNADCAAWREKAKTLSSGNPLRVQMRAACRNCERNKR